MTVSSLHSSVIGSWVPGVSSVSDSSTSSSSVSSSVSSSYDSCSFSSAGRMMAAEGQHPPDYDSMSTDEFCDHLVELQAAMAEQGIDTSSFVDPTTLTDDELNALKDEMASMGAGGPQGKQGPPPPPPPSYETSVDEEVDTLDLLLQAMEEENETVTSLFDAFA